MPAALIAGSMASPVAGFDAKKLAVADARRSPMKSCPDTGMSVFPGNMF